MKYCLKEHRYLSGYVCAINGDSYEINVLVGEVEGIEEILKNDRFIDVITSKAMAEEMSKMKNTCIKSYQNLKKKE